MAFIQLVSEEGHTYSVNKYFLQLYDNFFYNLLEDHLNNDIVIHLQGESNESMEKFVNSVNWRHITCSQERIVPLNSDDFSLEPCGKQKLDGDLKNNIDDKNEISEEDEDSKPPKTTMEKPDNSNDDKESILKPPTVDEQESKSKSLTSHIKPDNEEWKEGENLLCPFGEDSYITMIPDEMYAHISINHKLEKGRPSSHKMTATHFLLKNLSHRVSKQCFLCKGTNFEYKDRQKLKEHYRRMH